MFGALLTSGGSGNFVGKGAVEAKARAAAASKFPKD